jgi:hypothetical protein
VIQDWGYRTLPRIFKVLGAIPSTKKKKKNTNDYESGRSTWQTWWVGWMSGPCAPGLALSYTANLHSVSSVLHAEPERWKIKNSQSSSKTLNVWMENKTQKEKPLCMPVICNQSKQICKCFLEIAGKKF